MTSASTSAARRTPSRPKQAASWVDLRGHPEAPGLVGQIFFAFDMEDLDSDDERKLDLLCDTFKIHLLRETVKFDLFGGGCHIGRSKYNYQLGLRRAEAVKKHLSKRLGRMANYSARSDSRGEKYPTGKTLIYDRRVDIFSSYTPPQRIRVSPMHIHGVYSGPLSRKFLFRTVGGGGGGKAGAATQMLVIDIKNSRTGKTARYTYVGAGVGAGFPVSGARAHIR